MLGEYGLPDDHTFPSVTKSCAILGRLDVETARKVFDEMPERNVVSWTGMIYGYAQLGLNEEALKLFKQALYDDLEGSKYMGCVKTSFESSNYVGSSLVSLYSKCGVIDEAYLVFAEVGPHGTIHENPAINVYEVFWSCFALDFVGLL
ncbi:hypothetical protein Pint_18088 [Pistacia integerrima]|uniref:Uncharacterized protein n=1 Tax=Pistacia integerrima TaxID=434235 RepID=A0ACC0YYV0_9ROSI|nr:hypothetical protein Pint_18088 [Pistacia integerrima]